MQWHCIKCKYILFLRVLAYLLTTVNIVNEQSLVCMLYLLKERSCDLIKQSYCHTHVHTVLDIQRFFDNPQFLFTTGLHDLNSVHLCTFVHTCLLYYVCSFSLVEAINK